MLEASRKNAGWRRPVSTASRIAAASSSTSPSGYAIDTPLARSVMPLKLMYGAIRKTHDRRPMPSDRISESIRPARSEIGFRRRTSSTRPAISAGYTVR